MFAAVGHRPVHTARRLVFSLLLVPALLSLAACGGSAPPPTAKPDAKPTSSAPKTSASPGASPAAKPSPSPSPAVAGLQILDATLADATPWVSLRLTGGEPQIVSGWRLEVGDQSVTIPGNAIVQPDDTLTLHAGEGRSSDREVFLGPESDALALAAKPGARVRLLDETGVVKAETTVPRF
jgi:predicted small lipoprotein YifL